MGPDMAQGGGIPDEGGMADGIAEPMAGGMPDGIAEPIAGGMPDGMADPMAGCMPDGIAEPMAGCMPGCMPGCIAENIPGAIADGIPGCIAPCMGAPIPGNPPCAAAGEAPEMKPKAEPWLEPADTPWKPLLAAAPGPAMLPKLPGAAGTYGEGCIPHPRGIPNAGFGAAAWGICCGMPICGCNGAGWLPIMPGNPAMGLPGIGVPCMVPWAAYAGPPLMERFAKSPGPEPCAPTLSCGAPAAMPIVGCMAAWLCTSRPARTKGCPWGSGAGTSAGEVFTDRLPKRPPSPSCCCGGMAWTGSSTSPSGALGAGATGAASSRSMEADPPPPMTSPTGAASGTGSPKSKRSVTGAGAAGAAVPPPAELFGSSSSWLLRPNMHSTFVALTWHWGTFWASKSCAE
mmetsp:Transcript_30769/g.91384  ORF Transcript_30769/g.91384 Transcript_30769/m.91384 type:complete len:401 (+) Transcript_30769:311-1513(+)